MQLVILAAGRGQRFGGLKQLAPVGPGGQAIMDYTAASAKDCGFDGVVLVVREEIEDEVKAHVARHFPAGLAVEFVHQGPRRGTAEAVAAAARVVEGPFGVANADDLYGANAIGAIPAHFAAAGSRGEEIPHVLVGYQLLRTVLTAEPVTRGLIEVGPNGSLARIVEHTVTLRDDGRFDAVPLANPNEEPFTLSGQEPVSMNLWGFAPRFFTTIDDAFTNFDPNAGRLELLLPEVVGQLVATGSDEVTVVSTDARCIGITHPDDLAVVREELSVSGATDPIRASRPS